MMSKNSMASKIISFNENLVFDGQLPMDFKVLNPFTSNPETFVVMRAFYEKYYNDQHSRKFLIGINPSRHGAGVTGVPFTDTKRLESVCGIRMESSYSHELSAVFMYDMIEAFGGPEVFYRQFYINSPFPLAIIRKNSKGRWLNANYYDDKALFDEVKDFMIQTLKQHIEFGLNTDCVYVLGKKNAKFIEKLNDQGSLFQKMLVLEHPRYIQQYQSRFKESYIDKYLIAMHSN